MTPSSTTKEYHFFKVSLLITHYNRSSSLKRLLMAFESLKCHFGEIVVSDDGSNEDHLNAVIALSNEHKFRLIQAQKNGGLGITLIRDKMRLQIYIHYIYRKTLYQRKLFLKNWSQP